MPPPVPQYYCNQAPTPQLTQQAMQAGGGDQLLTVRILTDLFVAILLSLKPYRRR
jgi:hypothetical protein